MTSARKSAYHGIYLIAATAIAVVMFVGFAKNYYLRAWIGTRVITFLVHIHGLIMSAWVLLFVTQTFLVSKREVALHRSLGILGSVLAGLVFALGIYTIISSIKRHHSDPNAALFATLFVAFDGISLVVFAGLVIAALINRGRPQIHKRLMLLAMISLLPPAFGRFVAYFTHLDIELIVLGLMYASVLMCLLVDCWQHRRLHPAFAIGGLLILVANQLTYFAQTQI